MRPRCEVESILTFKVGSNGSWIPVRVGISSWVTLQPEKRGGHAKDAREHSEEGGYKARVMKFRFKQGSTIVSDVLVQHVYTHRQVKLNAENVHGGCNYLYLSPYQDWIDPKSILDVLYVLHAEVGEAQRGEQTHKSLLKMGIYFYNAIYYPKEGGGRLEMIPLPSFDDPEWPLPDMTTSESFTSRLRSDFLGAMKPTVSSKSTHIAWFMPVHVMVDLFAPAAMYQTITLFVFKNLTQAAFESIMDEGWDTKISVGMDVIKCVVDQSSVVFRYHLGRSMLYCNFHYNRQRLQRGSEWENLEHVDNNELVKINCEIPGQEEVVQLEVGSLWSLSSVEEKINIYFGYNDEEYSMCIVENGHIFEKVNVRNEKNKSVAKVLPPRSLRILLL